MRGLREIHSDIISTTEENTQEDINSDFHIKILHNGDSKICIFGTGVE